MSVQDKPDLTFLQKLARMFNPFPNPSATDTAPVKPPSDPGEPTNRLPIMNQELGISQEAYYTRFELYQYNPDELLSKKGLRQLEKMALGDDVISMGLTALKMLRLSSGYEIVEASPDPLDLQIADEVADNFDFLQGTLREKLLSIMGSLEMGWSLHEKIWDFWEVGPWKGHVRLRTLKSKNPQWFNPSVDDFNNITGIVMISPPAYARKLPHQKFMVYSAQKRYENVFGTSRIRSLYDWWYLKSIAKGALSVITKKYGKETPIGFYPMTMQAGDKTAFLNALANLATNAAVLMPENTKIEFAKMDFSSINGLMAIIEKADQQMTRILLGQLMSSGTSGGQAHKGGNQQGGGTNSGGGKGGSDFQQATLDMYLQYIGDDIADNPIAAVIKEIVDLNYDGVIKYPKFKFKPLAAQDLTQSISIWNDSVKNGVVQNTPDDEEHIREILGFPSLSGKTTLRPNRYKNAGKEKIAPPREPVDPRLFPIGGYRPPTPSAPGLPANYAEQDAPAKRVNIIFIRHGSTQLNSEDKLRSWLNPPVDDNGKSQTEEIVQALKGVSLDKIYSSDLQRAEYVAAAIAKPRDLQVKTTPDLRPINFGQWNGQWIKKIQPAMDELYREWESDPKAKAEGGESFKDYQDRTLAFLERCFENLNDGDTVAIVGHLRTAAIFTALAANGGKPLEGRKIALFHAQNIPKPGGILRFSIGPGGLRREGNKPSSASLSEFKPRRRLTQYEKRVDFAEALNTMQAKGVDKIMPAAAAVINKAVDKLKAQIKRIGNDTSKIKRLTLPYKQELARTISDGLEDVAKDAMRQAKGEIRSARKLAEIDTRDQNIPPEDVIDYVRDAGFMAAKHVSDDVMKIISDQMMSGIKSGDSYQDMVNNIETAIAPYIDTTQDDDAETFSGARLNTIVRTNVSTAFNEGKRAVYTDPELEGFVSGIQWSSILDDRTCFEAGTVVKLSNGNYKAIESIMPGDRVIGGSGISRKVKGVKKFGSIRWVRFTLASGKKVVSTDTHPFWAVIDGQASWIEAKDLSEGDCLGTLDMPVLPKRISTACLGGKKILFQKMLAFKPRREMAGKIMSMVQKGFQSSGTLCKAFSTFRKILQSSLLSDAHKKRASEKRDDILLREMRGYFLSESGVHIEWSQGEMVFKSLPKESLWLYLRRLWKGWPIESKDKEILFSRLLSESGNGNTDGADGASGIGDFESRFFTGSPDRQIFPGFPDHGENSPRSGRPILARKQKGIRFTEGGTDLREGLAIAEIEDRLLNRRGESRILSARHAGNIPTPTGSVQIVGKEAWTQYAPCYDLEVEGDHSYLVTEDNLIAHNTDFCTMMDSRIYRATNPVLSGLPPAHFNCRSTLIPITTADGWDGEESDPPDFEPDF